MPPLWSYPRPAMVTFHVESCNHLYIAGTRGAESCNHCRGKLQPLPNFAFFCYRRLFFCWNQHNFLLPLVFGYAETSPNFCNFCYRQRFSLLERTLFFATTGVFYFAGTTPNLHVFCYHLFLVYWNQCHVFLPPSFWMQTMVLSCENRQTSR